MNTKLSESNGEPCTWRHVSTVRGQALENLPSKDGKALSAEPTHTLCMVQMASLAISIIITQRRKPSILLKMVQVLGPFLMLLENALQQGH